MKHKEGQKPYLSLKGIDRFFGITKALQKVDLDIYEGEVIGLVGPNGAGKSTMMKILTGVLPKTAGQIIYNGVPEENYNAKIAKQIGVSCAYQDLSLCTNLSIFENFAMLNVSHSIAPSKNWRNKTKTEVEKLLEKYFPGSNIDVTKPIETLSLTDRQVVEICKTLMADHLKILILDEPTAVLTPQETEKLFRVLRKMRDDGKAIVIITHKMHEVESLSDRVAVLRNGQYIDSMATKDTDVTEMTNMMVGHAVTLNIERPDPVDPKPRIEVKGLTVRSEEGIVKLDDVSFTANSGEILGIAGISGCGQKELLEAIAGLQVTEAGEIYYIEDDGSREMLIGKDPLKIAEMGVSLSFVPEDRLGMGLVGNMDLTDNMMLRSFRRGRTPFTNRKPPKKLAKDVVENLEVVTPGITTPIRRLSGGNVQKVLVGREIASAPTVLLTAYAVRGLDINSSYTIYELINEQKKKGVAVIFVGEDLDVLLELSDKILVLCGGKVSGIVDARKTDKNEVGMMMTRVGGSENHE